ncbi:hypothetical protein AB0J52_33300 [Spirillospora sp. NPDC049652]
MAFIDTFYELGFEGGIGSRPPVPFPAPFGAPDELVQAARAAIEAREIAHDAEAKAHDAFADARQAEADDKAAALEAARNGEGHAPLAPGLFGLAHEADDAARVAVHAAQSAYYAYVDLYNEIMADPERRTAWLARVLPEYEAAADKLRADFTSLRDRASGVAAWQHMAYKLAGTPHADRQTVGANGPITDPFMISNIATLTTEPEWLPIARDLLTDHNTDKDAA